MNESPLVVVRGAVANHLCDHQRGVYLVCRHLDSATRAELVDDLAVIVPSLVALTEVQVTPRGKIRPPSLHFGWCAERLSELRVIAKRIYECIANRMPDELQQGGPPVIAAVLTSLDLIVVAFSERASVLHTRDRRTSQVSLVCKFVEEQVGSGALDPVQAAARGVLGAGLSRSGWISVAGFQVHRGDSLELSVDTRVTDPFPCRIADDERALTLVFPNSAADKETNEDKGDRRCIVRRVRARTISMKRLTKEELRIGALLYPERSYWRPKKREE